MKNPIPSFALSVLCALAALRPLPALGQESSPLAGKTVHLWNPFPETLPQIVLLGNPVTVAAEAGPWVRFDFSSLGAALRPEMAGFHFQTADFRRFFGRDGLTGSGDFTSADFAGADAIWIMADPAGDPLAPPHILASLPRRAHVFNPWPISGPRMVLNGTPKGMLADREHCGWYLAYFLDAGPARAHFIDVADGEAWGKGGFGSAADFDLATEFAAKGPDLYITGEGVTGTFPGKEGDCTYLMAATVHDLAHSHPDYNAPGSLTPGMVAPSLGTDGKPVPTSLAPARFNTWFNSDSTRPMPLKGYESCVDLEMGKSDDGQWEYDSFRTPAKGYFPIDDANRLDANTSNTCYTDPVTLQSVGLDQKHNFGFCMESHASFIYKKGQVFEFRGDDDVWVFIDGRLRLDLGGVHVATPGSIAMDSLGLIEGKEYKWDFFFCERKECSSSLRIKTTIYFKQQRALDHAEERQPDGSIRYQITKHEGGTGSCGSATGTFRDVDPEKLVYELYGEDGTRLGGLPEGLSHGGIRITTPKVEVDTSKIGDLPPGDYRIVFFEPSNTGTQDQVAFTLAARNRVEFDPPYQVRAPLGSLVPVVAANRIGDTLFAGIAPYSPSIPAGLRVFEDPSRTRRVTQGAVLSTGSDGLDTLWATGDPSATDDRTYTLSIPGSVRKVELTFLLPPLDLPRVTSAFIFDDDADGVADRMAATFDRDISAVPPKLLEVRWPVSGKPLNIPRESMGAFLSGGSTLTLAGASLAPGVSPSVLTSGTGRLSSTYPARSRDSVQEVPILDRIAPILLSAEMAIGNLGDTLRMRFSEPVATAKIAAAAGDLFLYRRALADADLRFAPSSLRWNAAADRADLIFPPGAAPRAGYVVRILDGRGRISDMEGNGAGPNSRFRLITGAKREEIGTVTFKRIDPDAFPDPKAGLSVTLEPLDAEAGEVVERTGMLGHLIKADLGDYALGDDFRKTDPSRVTLEYQVFYFTNQAVPVASEQRIFSCLDPLYRGDCRINRGYPFIGWNYIAANGQKAATGAYVARLVYRIRVEGRLVSSGALDQVWGILRSR